MIENRIYRNSLSQVLSCIRPCKKTFLITGATGLIGSCITDLLMLANQKGKQNHVYTLGRSRGKLEKRFATYISNNYFHIIEQDICNPILNELEFDFIIHAASNADPMSYAKYPVETMITNIIGGYHVLEYGRKHSNCKITLLSTFEVYGNNGNNIYKETDAGVIDFNKFRACYPESKRSLEVLSRCYVDEYGVNVNIARLCSIYGPTMLVDDSKAHAQFLKNALDNKDIVLKSYGTQQRTYCYVIDAITAIFTILFDGATKESYNISNENAVSSIANIAKVIASIAGQKVISELPSDMETKGFSKPQNCILDNSKLRNLGWRGKYDIVKGFTECYNILKLTQKEVSRD